MKCVWRIAMCAALALSACRRPAPEDPAAWEKNPGLDPHPAGETLQGPVGAKLPHLSFRLDPRRGMSATQEVSGRTGEEELYLTAARSGQGWAQTKIGMRFVQEADDLRRLGEGVRWLNEAADQNDAEALRVLSMLASEGRGMDQSDKQAFKYMSRAAEIGSPEAQYELAIMLINGRGMPRDTEAAIVWGRKAAQQGHDKAQFSIGRMLIESIDQERKNEGIEFLRRAIAGGNTTAAIFLATVKARGDFDVPKDELEAETILTPFAEKGDAECQFALANLYGMGASFTGKRGQAMEWLVRSADAGNERAQATLAKIRAAQPGL